MIVETSICKNEPVSSVYRMVQLAICSTRGSCSAWSSDLVLTHAIDVVNLLKMSMTFQSSIKRHGSMSLMLESSSSIWTILHLAITNAIVARHVTSLVLQVIEALKAMEPINLEDRDSAPGSEASHLPQVKIRSI